MKNEKKDIIDNTEKTASQKKSSAKKNSKVKKEPKTISAKKLPKIFRKKYLPKAYEKKILKRIYVDSDKKLIESLFEIKKDNEVYFIPEDKNIPTKDFKRLKLVAKQIKQQKGKILCLH